MGSVGATNCGTTPLRSHRTYRISPHPGGVSELMGGGPPRLLRAAVPLDVAVVLTSFPPREPTCRLADKGRLGSLGGWRAGLCAPAAAYPPLLHTRVRRTGERIRHGSRLGKASLCPPPRGVLPRPHEAPWLVRGHVMGIRVCTGKGYTGLPLTWVAWGIACHACTHTQLLLKYTRHGIIRYLSGR